MRKYGLKPPRLWYRKPFSTIISREYTDDFTNLIKEIKQPNINQIWVSDLTYLKYQGKFLYLAVIKDLASKEILTYNVSDKHDSDLVLETIKEAELKHLIVPEIFHSDRGREFLAEKCIVHLQAAGVKISVSDRGCPWQNGSCESFFSRFKAEAGDLNRFETLGELAEYIYQYIEYYNNYRIVTQLKMSPSQYRQKVSESVLDILGA
jgi:putative transposase